MITRAAQVLLVLAGVVAAVALLALGWNLAQAAARGPAWRRRLLAAGLAVLALAGLAHPRVQQALAERRPVHRLMAACERIYFWFHETFTGSSPWTCYAIVEDPDRDLRPSNSSDSPDRGNSGARLETLKRLLDAGLIDERTAQVVLAALARELEAALDPAADPADPHAAGRRAEVRALVNRLAAEGPADRNVTRRADAGLPRTPATPTPAQGA